MTVRSKAPLLALPLLVLVPLVPLAAIHCGSGLTPDPYVVPDSGVAFSFSPKGCAYKVAIPLTRPFTKFAADTAAAPTSAADGVPVRVRVGLGGDTTKPATDGGAAATVSSDGGVPVSSYADPSTSASFVWETSGYTTNAKVRLGTSPTSFTTTQSGFVFSSPPPTVGFGTGELPANMHQVDVCGLTPGTTYYYQVGGGAAGSEIWSATQSFTTVPAAGNPIVVGIYGDARDTETTWELVNQRMQGAAPNLLLISGDIVNFGTQESLWTEWLDDIWSGGDGGTGSLGQFIMVPIAGNHENEASQFFANFSLPGTGDYAKDYFSFDVGNTHFVMIDDQQLAEAPTSDEATKILAWLETDLRTANADRVRHPFIVEINHRGLYSTSNHAVDSDVLQARQSLSPIFTKYDVNLVFNGHDHEYERSKPLTAGSQAQGAPVVQPSLAQGTTYVINAGAGADPYLVGTAQSNFRQGDPTSFGTQLDGGKSPYIGCYILLTLQGQTMTLNAYGLKASGGGVAGDDVIDTVVFGQ